MALGMRQIHACSCAPCSHARGWGCLEEAPGAPEVRPSALVAQMVHDPQGRAGTQSRSHTVAGQQRWRRRAASGHRRATPAQHRQIGNQQPELARPAERSPRRVRPRAGAADGEPGSAGAVWARRVGGSRREGVQCGGATRPSMAPLLWFKGCFASAQFLECVCIAPKGKLV